MRKKVVCRLGICLLLLCVLFCVLFSDILLCRAAAADPALPLTENGSEAEGTPDPSSEPDSTSNPEPDPTSEPEPTPEPTPDVPVIKSVSISPGTAVVSPGSTCAFTAVVTGENDYSSEVTWSVSGQKSQNTFIDSKGVLNVGADETASSLTVKAVSTQDSSFSATALVSLRRTEYSVRVKASPDNGGTVSGGGKVEEGGYAVLSASSNEGFTFESWSLNGTVVSRDSRYVVDGIRSDRTYVANFRRSTFRINVTVNNSSAGAATESKTVEYGGSLTLEAVAKDGHQFDGWMENGKIVSRDSRIQLSNITASRDFVATFSQSRPACTLTLAALPAEAGAVSGQGSYAKGSNVKIIAIPASGYRFTGWTENGSSVSKNQEYSVNNLSGDRYLVANFERKTHTIQAAVSSPNGTITPEGKSTVAEGGEITYTIKPKSGYAVRAVYVDGKPVGAVASYSFTDVKGNHNISVDFTAAPGRGSSAQPSEKDKTGKAEKDKTDRTEKNTTDKTGKAKEEEEDAAAGQEKAEVSNLTGTLQYLNISPEEAERLIDAGDERALMLGALATGDLQLTVQNDFGDNGQKSSVHGFDEASGTVNFEKVIGGILTRKEKMEMLKGDAPIDVALRIRDAGGEVPELVVRMFEENSVPEREIVQYFEMSLTKSGENDTQAISELPRKLQVVINVPGHLKAARRDFYILRSHIGENGEMEYTELADEDSSPDTISFSTDRFSFYAIAYTDREQERVKRTEGPEEMSGGRNLINLMMVAAILLAAGITFLLVRYMVRRRVRRRPL